MSAKLIAFAASVLWPLCFVLDSLSAEGRPSADSTQDETSCLELVQECFAYASVERSQCFFAAASHSFCQGTQAGRITFRRWQMTPNQPLEEGSPYALLGPQIVDKSCLDNFDNLWSAQLIHGNLSRDTLARLESKLESCRRTPADQILRP